MDPESGGGRASSIKWEGDRLGQLCRRRSQPEAEGLWGRTWGLEAWGSGFGGLQKEVQGREWAETGLAE